MPENISEENLLKMHNNDYTHYAVYVARRRALPGIIDGLKPVHRKILYAMFKDHHLYPGVQFMKTMRIIGTVTGKYHPHGDASVKDAIKPMVNWFEIYMPLIEPHGSFGSMSGDDQAAPRYTEIRLSKYAYECIIAELAETDKAVDWIKTYDNSGLEPAYLPAAVPNLLINGAFGIAVGMKTQIPKHNINEVIDATIKLIRNPNTDVILIPDNCSGSDIIDNNFEKISHTGRGSYLVRGKMEEVEFKGKPTLSVVSMPDMVFFDTVKGQLENLFTTNVLPQIVDIYDLTEEDPKTNQENFKEYIVFKKGTDLKYVKDIIYATTSMQTTVSVNFEVILNESPVVMNYKQYLLEFIELRKQAKFRLYSNKLQISKTKYHEMELYIRAMESGEINNIIDMIKKQKGTDDAVYVDYLVSKLKITPLQAKFLLGTNIKELSLGYLNKYKAQRETFAIQVTEFTQLLTDPELLLKEIEADLKGFKKKYGCPRRSEIISKSMASGIPEGNFKVVITKNNFIKKIGIDDKVTTVGGDDAKFVIPAENKDILVIYGELGTVYTYPVHKIPFVLKGSNGVSIKSLVKKLTADVCCVMTESILEDVSKMLPKNYIYVITEDGNFKRMDLEDFLNVPPSGIIYSKLDQGDVIKDILFMPEECDLLIYSRNKVLRISGSEAPYVKRSTKGNNAMSTKNPIDGFACLYPSATDVVVVTESGRINKVSIKGVPLSARTRSGNSIIKLSKTDAIKRIMVCEASNKLVVTSKSGSSIEFIVSDIPEGSSIGAGVKLVDVGVIDAKII